MRKKDMTHISDLFPESELAALVDDGYVRRFEHDNGDLLGYNYTAKAQYDREWNPVTLQCRGLIVDTSGTVIARPFPKFFNLGERPEEDARRHGKPFTLHEKIDGSLGIHYRWNGSEAIATRGSFHSEQANWATAQLERQGRPDVPDDVTLLFEIVYPDNRIVVDYGDRAEIVLLDALHIPTGARHPVQWPYQWRATTYGTPTHITQVKGDFAQMDDGNFEGLVAVFDDGYRVKLKLDEYVRLHRIMATTSNRTIWEALRAGSDIDQMIESTPDEFMSWVKAQIADFNQRYDEIDTAARTEFDRISADVGVEDRKTFALFAKESQFAPLLFAMLDGKDYTDGIWKRLRPDIIEYPPIGGGGDTAD